MDIISNSYKPSDIVTDKIAVESIQINGLDSIYAAVAFGGGIAYGDYKIKTPDGSFENARFNRSFFLILFQLLNNSKRLHGASFDIQPSAAIVTFSEKHSSVQKGISDLFSLLESSQFSKNEFQDAKTAFIDNFRKKFSDANFRGRLKAYEFLFMGKRFSLRSFLEDINDIAYSDFIRTITDVISPSNTTIQIMGNDVASTLEDLDALPVSAIFERPAIAWRGRSLDPYILQDKHTITSSSENIGISCVRVCFGNSTSMLEKLLICDMLLSLSDHSNMEQHVDRFDCGFIIKADGHASDGHASIRRSLALPSSERYEKSKDICLSRYALLLQDAPQDFCALAAQLKLEGIDLFEYLKMLSSIEFSDFQNIYKNADVILREGQVIMTKGELS